MFPTNYPSFAALLVLSATLGKDFAVQNETFVQKLEGAVNIVSPIITFLPQASSLGAELEKLKASAPDMEAAGEFLVTQLAFSSDKAQGIIKAAFPLAEGLVALIPQTQALLAAIKV
jgi:hypothetical protein